MFELFTDRARQVLVLAQEEARTLSHNHIGTEHVLLGLLREQEGLAARVLESLDITVERVRALVERIVGRGEEVTSGQIPFTRRAKKVLELALGEAQDLGHNYIGTEHLLLGLTRENEGVAARILLDFNADAEGIRNEVARMLADDGPSDRGGRRRGRRRGRRGDRAARVAVGHAPGLVAWLGRALVTTASEAQGDGGRAVDDGDFLLALARQRDGVAAHALADLGFDEQQLREAVRRARRSHDGSGGNESDAA